MSEAGKTFRRWRPVLVVGVVLLLVATLIWWAVKEFATPGGKKKRVIQTIEMVRPPPPPPPKVEPPKPEIKEKIEVPKPDSDPQKQTEAPPNTGIQEGPAGGMATDLGVGTGTGIIGGGGSRFAWYGALVKERIQETLARDKKLRNADYRIVVNVWIDATGAVKQAELTASTGDVALDGALKLALSSLPPVREGAPVDMPQPIKLRITAR